ncbi:MAG TPA: hypothetical protein VN026_02620 [Bacteroidia bacterium]|jgi:hypothetical protein|nr:hypothetical protein [Bacteroidia bacterium]
MQFKLIALTMALGTNFLIGQVTLSTNIPSSLALGSTTDVEVKINKGSIANFAKYQMDVPVGVTVAEVDSKSGNFTFENNRAKIVWVSVPSDAEFTLKFKVSVSASAPAEGAVIQKFYFLENGAKKEVEAEPMNVAFGGSTKNLSTTTTQTKAEPVKTTPAKTEPVKTEPAKTEPVKENINTTPAAAGLIYRVQLAASPTDPGKSKYAALGNKVEISKEDGSYKVLYGKYNTKEEGLKGFEEASAKGFKGFLVKYQNGVRVK